MIEITLEETCRYGAPLGLANNSPVVRFIRVCVCVSVCALCNV